MKLLEDTVRRAAVVNKSCILDSYFEHECRLLLEEEVVYRDMRKKGNILILRRWWHDLFLLSYENKSARQFYLTHFAMRQERIKQFRQHRGSIHPWSVFRLHWTRLIMLCAIVNIFSFSLTSSIIYGSETYELQRVNMFCESMLLLDIILNFRTGYLDRTAKTVILDRKNISLHYLSTVIFVHTFSAIPLQMVSTLVNEDVHRRSSTDISSSLFLCVLRLINSSRIIRIFELSKCWMLMRGEVSSVFPWNSKMIKTLFIVVVTMHQVTEVGDTITLITMHLTKTWNKDSFLAYMLIQKHILKFSLLNLYSMDLARICNAVQSSSQGLYYNQGPIDRMTILINYFFGAFFFIWCILEAATYFYCKNYTINERAISYNRVVCMIRSRQLPDVMEHRIAEYFRNFAYDKLMPPKGNEIYTSLPRKLKNEITVVSKRYFLKNIPYFFEWPPHLVDEMTILLQKSAYLRGDTVIGAWTIEECFRIVESGVLAVYATNDEEMQHLIDGDYFGELSLFSDSELRKTSIVAITNCSVLELHKNDLDMLLRDHILLYITLRKSVFETYDKHTKESLASELEQVQ